MFTRFLQALLSRISFQLCSCQVQPKTHIISSKNSHELIYLQNVEVKQEMTTFMF